jgi:hypothetical protein
MPLEKTKEKKIAESAAQLKELSYEAIAELLYDLTEELSRRDARVIELDYEVKNLKAIINH